jgi:hypothetical protein
VHPFPDARFDAKHPRQEPCAVTPLARICAGGRPQGRSLPRPRQRTSRCCSTATGTKSQSEVKGDPMDPVVYIVVSVVYLLMCGIFGLYTPVEKGRQGRDVSSSGSCLARSAWSPKHGCRRLTRRGGQ